MCEGKNSNNLWFFLSLCDLDDMKKLLCITLFLLAASSMADADGVDPVREEWRRTWCQMGVDPALAESVVWPELQRYSAVRDVAETAANFGFCLIGEDGPDYSIGVFQMRPSFVEALEKAWIGSGLAEEYNISFDVSDTLSAKSRRIGRMSSDSWQAVYVGIFIIMLYHSYILAPLPIEDQVRMSAAAYNRGCSWTEAGRGNVKSLRRHAGARYSSTAWEHYKMIAE